tara:strand:- start:1881 stop:2444 length:564 start_codon:yes stop_codon:yes gene_type:complete
MRQKNMTKSNFFSGLFNTFTMMLLAIGIASTTKAESRTFAFNGEAFPQVQCMALNIYYESRGSNFADQVAVADVVLNRVNDRRYPDTVCDVVHQGKQKPSWKDKSVMVMVRNKCQFSWYCDGKADTPHMGDAWINAQTVAWRIIQFGEYRGLTEGATHYHATYVDPSWAGSLQLIGTIGKHVFYRWN